MMKKELISCAEGGPAPPEGMPDTSWYIGLYDDAGTIIEAFFDTEEEALVAFGRLTR